MLVTNQIPSATKLVLVKRLHRKLSSFCAALKDSCDQENNLLIFFANGLSLPEAICVVNEGWQNCDNLQQKLSNTSCIFNFHTETWNRYCCLCWESRTCELANCYECWKAFQEQYIHHIWKAVLHCRSTTLLIWWFLIEGFLHCHLLWMPRNVSYLICYFVITLNKEWEVDNPVIYVIWGWPKALQKSNEKLKHSKIGKWRVNSLYLSASTAIWVVY